MTDQLLVVEELSAGYLGEDVIHEVSLVVGLGEAVAVIGSNGAGKTTMFRAICGLGQSSGGRIQFAGEDITGTKAYQASRMGIAYVPAERHLFPHMSVRENLAIGAFPKRPPAELLNMVFELFPRLSERASQQAGTMSGGEQQMLAVGRALMSEPRLLMLDEPTTGLSPLLASEAYAALARLRGEGLTILVAEQQVPLALQLSDRGYVLDHGRIGLTGSSDELANDPGVRKAYLGI